MGVVKKDDIVAYQINETILCANCVGDRDTAVKEDDLILDSGRNDDDLIFCDECKELI